MADDALQAIERRITAIGTNPKAVGLLAGLGETYVRDLLKGRSRNPTASRLEKVYAVLDTLEAGRSPSFPSEVPDRVRRYAYAIYGCFGQNYRKAGRCLKLKAAQVKAIEQGEEPLTDELLILFHHRAGIPLWWFSEGRWTGIPPEIAGRMGHVVPTAWLPPVEDDVSRGGNPEAEEDESDP